MQILLLLRHLCALALQYTCQLILRLGASLFALLVLLGQVDVLLLQRLNLVLEYLLHLLDLLAALVPVPLQLNQLPGLDLRFSLRCQQIRAHRRAVPLEVCFKHGVLDYLLQQRRVSYSRDPVCQLRETLDVELDLLLSDL